MESALASGFATAELHHERGHDLRSSRQPPVMRFRGEVSE
jgi:hypothetical protein